MKFLKFSKKDLLATILLVGAFLASRLINLTTIPIFTDEAIYLRWAQIAKNDAAWRFISLTDGKQPLFIWFTMIAMKLISDPLVAGRVISIMAGLASLVAIWLLTFILFQNRRMAFFASLLYLFSPFALVYDRMALMDSLVGTFTLLSLSLSILLVKSLRLDTALLLGFSLGGGVLTKTSGFFNLYLLPFTLLAFDWKKERKWRLLTRWLILVSLAVVISQGFYSVLRLSPLFHMIAQKDTTFIYSFSEWLKHPIHFFWGNLKGEFDWLSKYLTWPWLLLTISAFFINQKDFLKKSLLLLWFLPPFLALALFGKVLYPRFIFFMILPLLVLVAYSLEQIILKTKNKFLVFSFSFLVFIYPAFINYQLLFNPPQAPIPFSDKGQYIVSWPSGIGVKEMIDFLEEKTSHGKIFVATEGTFGMFPASLELYLWENKNIEIKGYWPVKEIPQEVLEKAREMPTFFSFVIDQAGKEIPQHWPLELIAEYPKMEKPYSLRLYQVVAN